jgi:hypothetical protein
VQSVGSLEKFTAVEYGKAKSKINKAKKTFGGV